MAVIDRAAAHQGWPLRGVPLYPHNNIIAFQCCILKSHNEILGLARGQSCAISCI